MNKVLVSGIHFYLVKMYALTPYHFWGYLDCVATGWGCIFRASASAGAFFNLGGIAVYDARATAEQEWELFKILCPKEIMDIAESPDITTFQYIKVYNMLLALGFYDCATQFLESKYDLIKKNRAKNNETDLLVLTSTSMRQNKFSDDFVQLFISNVRNMHLQKHFKNYSEKYSKM